MSEIEITPTSLAVQLHWIDRVLSWRRRVTVPLTKVLGAEVGIAPDMALKQGAYISWLASDLPGILKVGAFRRLDKTLLFYSIRSGENAITIRLTGARHAAIVVEVADPVAVTSAINAAVGQPGAA